jgi:hypothetical protein
MLKKVNFQIFVDYIEELSNNSNLTWIQRNMHLHEFYRANLINLPDKVNPSMIYHILPSYTLNQELPRSNINISTRSFENIYASQRTMARILYNNGLQVRFNYRNSEGICNQILKHLEELETE